MSYLEFIIYKIFLFRIKQEWELSFQNKFEYFTQKNPTHKWIMSLEKVTKDHPLRREQKWERFLGEKVEAGFKCQMPVKIYIQNNILCDIFEISYICPLLSLEMRIRMGIEKSMDKLLDVAESTK
jgi:hypothetical protein